MKFSIVTISFNQAKFLEQAILSVLEQSGVDVEYIVVDAGSTDGSRELILKHRDRINHIIMEPDEGPADGLNKGFALATGEIYGYLNADDILLAGTLSRVQSYLSKRPDVDVVSGHGFLIDERGRRLHRVFSHRFDLKRYAAQRCVLIQQSTFFRAEIFKKVGGFNKQARIAWDGELAVDFALAGAKFAVAHEYWSCFRIHNDCITGSPTFHLRMQDHYATIRRRLGLSAFSKLEDRYFWLTGWLGQPKTLVSRLVDGLKYPRRVL